jgi:hypothetical protein
MRPLVLALALLCGCAAQEPAPPPPRDLAALGSSLAIGKSTKHDALAALGAGEVIDFDSGYEVWVYREKPPARHTELVLLFEPSGVLAKTRVR